MEESIQDMKIECELLRSMYSGMPHDIAHRMVSHGAENALVHVCYMTKNINIRHRSLPSHRLQFGVQDQGSKRVASGDGLVYLLVEIETSICPRIEMNKWKKVKKDSGPILSPFPPSL